MFGEHYSEKKKQLLEVWGRYQAFCSTNEFNDDVERLESQLEKIKNEFYTLAVAGEAKAGKSTMINAILGEQILPTDVLQKSCAIVEIFSSEKKYIDVLYADGKTKRMEDDLATEALREIGALQDKYRDIPTSLIDAYIIDKYNNPNSGEIDKFIDELEEKSNMRLENERENIKQYIKERKPSEIPQVIRLGFPFKFANNGLKIVDTPGVNAVGGLELMTNSFLNNANAVIFVHSLKVPIESGSFNRFLENNIKDRAKKSLLLLLSHTGTEGSLKSEVKENEAKRMLKDKNFDNNHIFCVDSMFELMKLDADRFDSPYDLKNHYMDQKNYFEKEYTSTRKSEHRELAVIFSDKFDLLAKILNESSENVDNVILKEQLKNRSNFEKLNLVIDEIAMEGPEKELDECFNSIKISYENIDKLISNDISLKSKKIENNEDFNNTILKLSDGIKKCEADFKKFNSMIKLKYEGDISSGVGYLEDLKKILEDTQERSINHNIETNEATDVFTKASEIASTFVFTKFSINAMLQKITEEIIDEVKEFYKNIKIEIDDEFEEFQRKLEDNFEKNLDFSLPKIDLTGVESSTIDSVKRVSEFAELTSWIYKKFDNIATSIPGDWNPLVIPIISNWVNKLHDMLAEQRKGKLRNLLKAETDSVIDTARNEIKNLVQKYTKEIEFEFKNLIESTNNKLEEKRNEKKSEDELKSDIEKIQEIQIELEKLVGQIRNILEVENE